MINSLLLHVVYRWYLAEYDVTEYDIEVELTEDKLQTIRAKASRSAGRWTCDYRELPLGKHKKEIEVNVMT